MSVKIAVLGAGAWGTAVAKVITEKGNGVILWSHSKSTLEDINLGHVNSRYLPEVTLPDNLRACD
ncbi:MAG: glycerol-3-phosphate dehydrogenase, partial [Treponema sp.]|nr:glycerol-3-phosphate dehydrogenase [Treponema sp.]